ncbi:MAG: hypothetical protein JSS72_11700 [Armatimonadetes bacterium]|nr:hypothetical protein [Armatimonadota bacterium]
MNQCIAVIALVPIVAGCGGQQSPAKLRVVIPVHFRGLLYFPAEGKPVPGELTVTFDEKGKTDTPYDVLGRTSSISVYSTSGDKIPQDVERTVGEHSIAFRWAAGYTTQLPDGHKYTCVTVGTKSDANYSRHGVFQSDPDEVVK